jgi:hypothetical protein
MEVVVFSRWKGTTFLRKRFHISVVDGQVAELEDIS